MMGHPHHHRSPRSLSRRLGSLIYAGQERYNIMLLKMQCWWHRPRISSRSEVLADGRIKKKLRIATPRPLNNFSFWGGAKTPSFPVLLLLILALLMLFVFGEAYVNRKQIFSMTIGKWGAPPGW